MNFFTNPGILVWAYGPPAACQTGVGLRGACGRGSGVSRRSVMAKKQFGFSVERATRALQESVSRSGPVAAASYTLVGAIVLLGGLGYGVDRWQGTSPWCLLGGLTLGIVVGFYELIKVAWPR